ncbi:hypothetical protein C8J57DRAFT_1575069 [Mycena rebaudengoi]|nr:hypothetical protein C8J57DRAFT_1575069 [Mycena rebaudengoi]
MIYKWCGRESQSMHVGVGVGGVGGWWNGGVTREWNVERRSNPPIGSLAAQYTYAHPLTLAWHRSLREWGKLRERVPGDVLVRKALRCMRGDLRGVRRNRLPHPGLHRSKSAKRGSRGGVHYVVATSARSARPTALHTPLLLLRIRTEAAVAATAAVAGTGAWRGTYTISASPSSDSRLSSDAAEERHTIGRYMRGLCEVGGGVGVLRRSRRLASKSAGVVSRSRWCGALRRSLRMWTTQAMTRGCRSRGPANNQKKHVSIRKRRGGGGEQEKPTCCPTIPCPTPAPDHPDIRAVPSACAALRPASCIVASARRFPGRAAQGVGGRAAWGAFIGAGVAYYRCAGDPALFPTSTIHPFPRWRPVARRRVCCAHSRRICIPNPAPLPLMLLRRLPFPTQRHHAKPFQRRIRNTVYAQWTQEYEDMTAVLTAPHGVVWKDVELALALDVVEDGMTSVTRCCCCAWCCVVIGGMAYTGYMDVG